MDPHLTLWHITVSHYSEKARWALDHKDLEHRRRTPVPGAHMAVALWLSRGRSVTFPILQIDGRAVPDSTAIIAALEQRFPHRPLYPEDPEERRRALELEEYFDEELGPHVRLLAFHELVNDPEKLAVSARKGTPPPMDRFPRAAAAYARLYTSLRFGVRDRDAAVKARAAIPAAFDRLEAELDGRDYLVGDRFTVADLTAAALFYIVVLPPEAPTKVEDMADSFVAFRESLSDHPGFRWVEEIWRRHHPRGAATAAAVGD